MGGVEETETEQRLEGEGHLTGNHRQEGVQRVREALAGSEDAHLACSCPGCWDEAFTQMPVPCPRQALASSQTSK